MSDADLHSNPTPIHTDAAPRSRTAFGSPIPIACVADCDGSGSVTVNELITMLNIALGNDEVSACPNGIPAAAGASIKSMAVMARIAPRFSMRIAVLP
jgi:hypothetical protein